MFSIIMPYYKNENVVRRSINSVMRQTVVEFELLIIDDGSKDSIAEIVNSYHDDRIKLFRQNNSGVASARNKGIKNARYPWICFLDSDDEWLEDHLSTLCLLHNKYPEASYLITSHRRLGSKVVDSSLLLPKEWEDDFITDNLLELVFTKGEVIHTNSICIHRNLFDKYGMFEEGVSVGEDTDLWYRFSMFTSPVITKKVTTLYHRDASFLTAHNKFSKEWPFCKREYILRDSTVAAERKQSMVLLLQRYELTACKHLIADGEKEVARKRFMDIKAKLSYRVNQQKRQVQFLLLLPKNLAMYICQYIYKRKQAKY